MITITVEGKEYQLDIEQAKKLNLLKEKNNRVKSWQEFHNKYINSEGYYWNNLYNNLRETVGPIMTKEQCTPYEATALAAFSKLLKLRRDWIGEWEPDWLNVEQDKYVLYTHNNNICSNCYVLGHNILTFPTAEMRDAFFENFKELIEKCKKLL